MGFTFFYRLKQYLAIMYPESKSSTITLADIKSLDNYYVSRYNGITEADITEDEYGWRWHYARE